METIHTRAVSLLAALSVFLLTTGCKGDVCNTPFGEGGVINLSLPDFAPLLNVGGAVIVTHDNYGFDMGHRGILVRHTSLYEFAAFDCSCPYDRDITLLPIEGWNGAVLECPSCGSRFETEYGNPLDGAATSCPLYQYTTHFDGYYTLEIYN